LNPAPPKVSVIIPTLNASRLLPGCLASLRSQDYPPNAIEIIVADGGSSDNTREIAGKAGARVLDNPLRVAESGKKVAMTQVTGEYVLFVDADNEISSNDFVRLAVEGLETFPEALGVESYYPASSKMGSFCKYLTATLHIGDPISWAMSVEPTLLNREDEFELWSFPKDSLAYPLGANGFMFRASDLRSASAETDFEDTEMALKIALKGTKKWLRLRGRGVHHYLVKGPMDFVRKRRRQTYHFLALRRLGGDRTSWTQMNPAMSPLGACCYCVSVVGPLFHCLRFLMKTHDARWLWHPAASLLSVFGLAWGVMTYYLTRHSADNEARLQPRQ
jgi:glycosyltransferase involved in cell wall biosynthesis